MYSIKGRNLFHLLRIEPRFLSRPTRSQAKIRSTLRWLSSCNKKLYTDGFIPIIVAHCYCTAAFNALKTNTNPTYM